MKNIELGGWGSGEDMGGAGGGETAVIRIYSMKFFQCVWKLSTYKHIAYLSEMHPHGPSS